MKTYLLTWNPSKWDWDEYADTVERINQEGHTYEEQWSCGNTKRICIGDRFFLMRLGVAPKGLIASGEITKEPYEAKHWNIDKASKG